MRLENHEMLVGNTPAVRFHSSDLPTAARLWIKLESYNPTGSVKDRACLGMIRVALADGTLRPGMILLDASSGNMGGALAYFGRIMGFGVTVVCGARLTTDKANFIRFWGAELIRHGEITMHGNTLCRNMIAQYPGRFCFLDQLHNPANPQSAYDTMGPELLADFCELSAVAGSLGSGGTMFGTARYLHDQAARARIITIEAASGTRLPGIAAFTDGDYITPFIQQGFDEQLFTQRTVVSQASAQKRMKELTAQGFFVGMQTAAVVHGAIEKACELGLSGDIVAISGDSGWKNLDALTSSRHG